MTSKLALARKKCIGSRSWIVGGGDWIGFRHAWNKFSNNIVMSVSVSVSLSVPISSTLNSRWFHPLGRIFHTVGKLASGDPRLTSSHISNSRGKRNSCTYKHAFLQAQGRPLLRLHLGHVLIFQPIVTAAVNDSPVTCVHHVQGTRLLQTTPNKEGIPK